MGSSRFPGKTLAEIDGKPTIWHLFNQLSGCQTVTNNILATTNNTADDSLAAYAEQQEWKVFRGSEDDVLGRYYKAARSFGADENTAIVRVTGDDIWPDPKVVDSLVLFYRALGGKVDVVCTERSDKFPYGTGLELFSFKALAIAYQDAKQPREREHVSPYIISNPDKFPQLQICPSQPFDGFPLSIDTKEDLECNRKLYLTLTKNLKFSAPFSLSEVLEGCQRLKCKND